MKRMLWTLSVCALLLIWTGCSRDTGPATSDVVPASGQTAQNSLPVTPTGDVGATVSVTGEVGVKRNTNQLLTGISYRPRDEGNLHLLVNIEKAFELIEVPTKSDNGGSYANGPYTNRQLTELEFLNSQVEFFTAGISQYETLSKDPPELREKAAKFIKLVLQKDWLHTRQFDWEDLFLQGQQLVGNDLTKSDPLVLAAVGQSAANSFHYRRAQELLFAAIRKFADSDYHSRYVVLAHRWLARFVLPFTRDADLRDTVRQNYIKAVEYWMVHDLRATPDEHAVVWQEVQLFFDVIFYNNYVIYANDGSQRTPEFCLKPILIDKVEALDGFPQYLRNMIAATHQQYVGMAWYNNAEADPIPRESMVMARESFLKAQAYFRQAHEINPYTPIPCQGLMTMATFQGDRPLVEKWFQKAVEIQPDLESTYMMRLESLSPRWGGSLEEMLSFAHQCAATEKFDTKVPGVFLECYRKVAIQGVPDATKKEVLRVMEKLAEQTSDDQGVFTRSSYLTMLASEAILQQDVQTAQEAIRKLGGKIDPSGYSVSLRVGDAGVFVGFVAALGTERQADALIVSDMFYHGGFEDLESLVRVKEALGRVKVEETSAAEQVYWNSAAKILDLYRKVISGEWIELSFTDPQQQIWQFRNYFRWRKLEGDVLQVGTDQSIDASVPFTANRPIVFECDVEIIDHFGSGFAAGIGVGFSPLDNSSGMTFAINPEEGVVEISTVFYESFYRAKWPMKPGKNRITVVAIPGYYQMQVNGEIVHEEANERFRLDIGGISVLTSKAANGGGVVQFSNARIRGWNSGLAPAERNAKTRLAYFKRITADDPENVHAWYEQGIIHLRYEEYADAEKCFQTALEHGANPDRVSLFMGEVYEARGEWAKAVEAFAPAIVSQEEHDAHFNAVLRQEATRALGRYSVKDEYHYDYRRRYLMKLVWLLHFAPDDRVRNPDRAGEVASKLIMFNFNEFPWIANRMLAASYADSDPEIAISKLGDALAQAPEDEKPQILAQLQAYRSGQPYLLQKGMHILPYPPIENNE